MSSGEKDKVSVFVEEEEATDDDSSTFTSDIRAALLKITGLVQDTDAGEDAEGVAATGRADSFSGLVSGEPRTSRLTSSFTPVWLPKGWELRGASNVRQ